ncbi:MAG: FISUMP domain-containing protein [Patescibacteria group bacterium]
MKNKKAFTLIELLVVIGILGLLTTIAVVALSQARSSARDVRRVADMKQVQTALELFMNENGRYPTEEEWSSGSIFSSLTNTNFMYIIPSAPVPADGTCDENENAYLYIPSANLNSYEISFCTGKQVSGILPGTMCMTPGGLVKNCESLIPNACDDETSIFYAGQEYDIVAIGSQCWMAENLNVGTAKLNNETLSTSTPEKYCYGATDIEVDPSGNCSIYGGLYTWDSAMQGGLSVCPSGWRIPSEEDFLNLMTFLSSDSSYICEGDPSFISKSISSKSYWSFSSLSTCSPGNNIETNNSSNLNIFPVGLRTHMNSYVNFGNFGNLLSSNYGHFLRVAYSNPTLVHMNEFPYSGYYALPIRCLKD